MKSFLHFFFNNYALSRVRININALHQSSERNLG